MDHNRTRMVTLSVVPSTERRVSSTRDDDNLPLVAGAPFSEAFQVTWPRPLARRIEIDARNEYRGLLSIKNDEDAALRWGDSTESLTYVHLLYHYFVDRKTRVTHDDIPDREINKALARLQNQSFEASAYSRKFIRKPEALEYRAFRSWYVAQRFCKGAGIEFNEPCPVVTPEATPPTSDFLEMGRRFEAWTKWTLPRQAWEYLTTLNQKQKAS